MSTEENTTHTFIKSLDGVIDFFFMSGLDTFSSLYINLMSVTFWEANPGLLYTPRFACVILFRDRMMVQHTPGQSDPAVQCAGARQPEAMGFQMVNGIQMALFLHCHIFLDIFLKGNFFVR